MTNKWRYLVTIVKPGFFGTIKEEHLQAELDRQGNQGWELVEILRTPSGTWSNTQLVFKKPG